MFSRLRFLLLLTAQKGRVACGTFDGRTAFTLVVTVAVPRVRKL